VCPNCGANLKRWDELSERERDRTLALPGRNVQNREHRTSNHLFCPRCNYEAHG